MTIKVYEYPKCGTCKRALKWLDANGVEYEKVHIVDKPPSKTFLTKAITKSELPIKRFFNTSGQSYRGGGFKDTLPTMSKKDAIAALAADGKLIKRPLIVTDDVVLVGFREAEYAAAFG